MPVAMFSNNIGGMDISSSPISVPDNSATGQSWNYEYAKTGAVTKVLGARTINSIADAQLQTLGIGLHHSVATDVRTAIRAAGTKLQVLNVTTGGTINQSEDTVAASSNFLASGSKQPVVFSNYNTVSGGTQLWAAGGGMSSIYGYTGSQITANGTPAPTGSMTTNVIAAGTGTFAAVGSYYYGLQLRKKSTQVYSNVSLDVIGTLINKTDNIGLSWTITNIDTTKYDQIIVWRSPFNGASGFTTGSIIAQLASTATSYTDTGSSILDTQNTPRNGNIVLDNSTLGSLTYKYLTTFKRRLVVANNSTIYLSDLNKPESWPATNVITIPSGGPITGLGIVGIPSEYTTGAEEYLCIFKERELWVLVGTNYTDWDLKQVDKTGCQGQSLIVPFNSFIAWIGLNGIFIWDGKGRPNRVSRPIYALFAEDGDLDIGNLYRGYGAYYESKNQVIWRISHRIKGVNKFTLKLDVRNTSTGAGLNLQNPEMNGVFLFDFDSTSYFGMLSYRDQTNFTEEILSGDSAGFTYQLYSSSSYAVQFDYETKAFDMGTPEKLKQFHRVLVWIERLTDNDLTLYYWADYRVRTEYQSKVRVSMAPMKGTQPALWDIALWDQAYWDDYTPDISQIQFNLNSYDNNNIGTSLKLKFEQLESSAPVRVHAFAIEYDEIGNLPLPTQQVG